MAARTLNGLMAVRVPFPGPPSSSSATILFGRMTYWAIVLAEAIRPTDKLGAEPVAQRFRRRFAARCWIHHPPRNFPCFAPLPRSTMEPVAKWMKGRKDTALIAEGPGRGEGAAAVATELLTSSDLQIRGRSRGFLPQSLDDYCKNRPSIHPEENQGEST